MYFKSKTTSLLILAITSIVCSEVLFSLFKDPEGPNLLIVTGMALAVYFASLTVYMLKSPLASSKRLLLAILIQVLLITCLYFFLN